MVSAPSFWIGCGLESRCVGRVYTRPIQKHGAGSHMLQLNIKFSWWWAYVPETCRAKNISIKLHSCIKLTFHIISWGKCTVKQQSSLVFKWFFAFSYSKFKAREQILFHIRLRPLLLKYGFSFFVYNPKVSWYLFWVSDTDNKPTAIRKFFRILWDSIRLAAFCSVCFHCYMQFTPQVDAWINFVHCLLINAQSVL